MPTSFRLVRPRTTLYWERSDSDTICNTLYCPHDYWLIPQTNTSLFIMFCPHSHDFQETSQKITHSNTTSSQASLTMEFLFIRLPKICILLVYIVPINPYKYYFNHAVTYLHNLIILLILMWIRRSFFRPLRPQVLHPLSTLFGLRCYTDDIIDKNWIRSYIRIWYDSDRIKLIISRAWFTHHLNGYALSTRPSHEHWWVNFPKTCIVAPRCSKCRGSCHTDWILC